MIPRKISKTPLAIYCWFFQVVIVLGLASVVVWLSLIPKSPIFSVTNVYINPGLDSQNTTLGHTEVVVKNTCLIFNLEISNPNKGIGIFYDDIHATVYHNNAVLGMKSIPAFYQGHNKALLTDNIVLVVDAHQQFGRGNSSGHIDFKMALQTAVKYQIFRWKTKNHSMDFEASLTLCPNGTVTQEEEKTKLHPKLKLTKD